jgi:hypothetical protein
MTELGKSDRTSPGSVRGSNATPAFRRREPAHSASSRSRPLHVKQTASTLGKVDTLAQQIA